MTTPSPTENAQDKVDPLATWPEKIYLQHGDDCDNTEPFNYRETTDITWCEDSIHACDVAYVRSDIVTSLEHQLAEASKITDAVGGMIKAKGRYHTAQWYVNLVAIHDEYMKGKK